MLLRNMIEDGQIQGELMNLSPGTYLYKAGELNKGFYFVTAGTVLAKGAEGSEVRLSAGKLLGLPDLMHERYRHTAFCDEAATVLFISKETMLQALQVHTALRFYFIQQLSKYTTHAIDAFE